MNDIKFFRKYLDARKTGRNIADLARELGTTRSNLYARLAQISLGRVKCMNDCIATSRLACIWEYKYKTRYMALPQNREADTVDELRNLIIEMSQEGFSGTKIAAYLGKDRTTILHHINKWKLSQ